MYVRVLAVSEFKPMYVCSFVSFAFLVNVCMGVTENVFCRGRITTCVREITSVPNSEFNAKY